MLLRDTVGNPLLIVQRWDVMIG